jgi:nucleotide-binding universal stress UspA family protein
MKKILLAVDFSEGTNASCNYVMELIKYYDTEIYLFHSYFDKILVSESGFPTGIGADTLMNRTVVGEIKEQAEKNIKDLKSYILSKIPKKKVHIIVEGGEAEDAIIFTAKEINADLIIIGNSGSASRGVFSGSISKKIMCNADVPVLMIPLEFCFEKLSNVLYLTEFSECDFEIINWIFALFGKQKIRIHTLHLDRGNRECTEKMNQLKAKIKETEDLICFNLVESQNEYEDVEKYIIDNSIDMIAFLSHKRNFLNKLFSSKFSKQDLYKTNIPLLAFKA